VEPHDHRRRSPPRNLKTTASGQPHPRAAHGPAAQRREAGAHAGDEPAQIRGSDTGAHCNRQAGDQQGRAEGLKKPDVWMPLYIAKYLADTQRLTTEGHGAYLLLIMDYWMAGPLPDDDEQLAAVTKMGIKEWKRMRLKLEPFFRVVDGRWRHKRIDAEKGGAQDNIEKKSKAGIAGAAKRWQTHAGANGKDVAYAVTGGMAPRMADAWQNDAPIPLKPPTPETKPKKSKTLSGKPDESTEILEFLNRKANRAYQAVPANLEIIQARFKEGYTAVQLRQVIVKKCREWLVDDKMAEYLRPKTLFNRTNFANYAGELVNDAT
jgi:uncharacterized phage protein (TIGR02220 family)